VVSGNAGEIGGRPVAGSRDRNATPALRCPQPASAIALRVLPFSKQEGEAMKQSVRIASISFVLAVGPVLAAAQDVNYDVDRTKNFAAVRTFAMKPMEQSENPLVDRRIMAAVAQTLTARGLRQVDHSPDVFVIPSMTVEMRKEITAWNTGYWPTYGGWYWGGWGPYWDAGWGGGTTTFSERNLQYNTLVIDMVDANTGALIWRGKGVKRVHSHWKPEKVDEKVHKTVAKIMENLPATGSASAHMSPP
jgi:uncharacterized protein DUF4136